MPCEPYNPATGFFIPMVWNSPMEFGEWSVELNESGSDYNFELHHGGSRADYVRVPSGENLNWCTYGDYLWLSYANVSAADTTYDIWVFLLDDGDTDHDELGGGPYRTESSGLNLMRSPDGLAFFIYLPTNIANRTRMHKVFRSDTLDQLAGAGPASGEGERTAEITDDQIVKIWRHGTVLDDEPLPVGDLDIDGGDFPEAVLEGAPEAASTTATFEICNDGNDCIIIEAIDNVSPFRVDSELELPFSLTPRQCEDIEVTFTPLEEGDTGDIALRIYTTPELDTPKELVCYARARTAHAEIVFRPNSIDFGNVPVMTTQSAILNIQNDGDRNLEVSWPARDEAPFHWDRGIGIEISPDGPDHSLSIEFTPQVSGPARAQLTVTSNDPESPHDITISGMGCRPRPEIRPIFPGSLDFGQLERGFRSVKFFLVNNTGSGILTFSARIDGTDRHLFGLQSPSGSVTELVNRQNFEVLPRESIACGETSGSHSVLIGVGFFADADPGPVNAELVLYDHNAEPPPGMSHPDEWTIPLQGEVIEQNSVDAVMILDRSGSMGDPLGSRDKMEAAISGAQLFAQLSRPGTGDRMAGVRYNQDADAFIPMTDIDTEETRQDLVNEIRSSALEPNGSTSIAGGLFSGLDQLDTPRVVEATGELRKAMVVLTDGKDNTAYLNPEDNIWYSLIGGSMRIPNLAGSLLNINIPTIAIPIPADVRIYGISLGEDENVDHGRLGVLCEQTGAVFQVTGDLNGAAYFNLEKYFTQIYMQTAIDSIMNDPVKTITPGGEHKISFDVLKGDVRFLIVIYDKEGLRLPFHLLTPAGEIVDVTDVPDEFKIRIGATKTARFVEVELLLGRPERYAGQWFLVVRHEWSTGVGIPREGDLAFGFLPAQEPKSCGWPVEYGYAIGTASNFRIETGLTPGIVRTGEDIELYTRVTEAGLGIKGCDISVEIKTPGGRYYEIVLEEELTTVEHPGYIPEYTGIFNHTQEAGSYSLTYRVRGFSLDGEPVHREEMRSKYIQGQKPLVEQPDSNQQKEIECCKKLKWLLVAICFLLIILIAVHFLK